MIAPELMRWAHWFNKQQKEGLLTKADQTPTARAWLAAKGELPRFLAVTHAWHVESKGFSVHELPEMTREQAEKEACSIAWARNDTCCSAAPFLIELEPAQRMKRKLTWRERLTGRIV